MAPVHSRRYLGTAPVGHHASPTFDRSGRPTYVGPASSAPPLAQALPRVAARAEDARPSRQRLATEDERLESLARFLHVAQASDDFGFDVLGYLSPFAGADPCPLLLEVKNAADRSFIASVPEWRRAEEQGDRYAFFVVLRESGSDLPAALELIPNPAELLKTGQIQRDEES